MATTNSTNLPNLTSSEYIVNYQQRKCMNCSQYIYLLEEEKWSVCSSCVQVVVGKAINLFCILKHQKDYIVELENLLDFALNDAKIQK